MKKRALSMLLALALCFTLFSGIGSAVNVDVDSVIDRAGNVLDNTRADQLRVIAEMANQAVVQAIEGEEDPNVVNADVKAFVDTVIPEEVFKNDVGMQTIYPYFILRYLQDGNASYDPNGAIADVIKQMEELDHNYNTSYNYETGEVIGLKKAFSMFNGYQKKLTDIVNQSQVEGALELEALGFFDTKAAEPGYKYNPVIYTYAKEVIAKSFAYFTPALYAQNGEDLSNTYDSIMNVDPADDAAIKATDIAKKNLSLVLGQDLLDAAMGGGVAAAARDYINAKKTAFVELVLKSDNYQKMFSADPAKAVEGAQGLMKEVAAYVLAAEAEDGDSAELTAALAKIKEVKAAIAERGSTAEEVLAAVFAIAEAADTNYADKTFVDAGYRAVGLDIALKSFVNLYDFAGVNPVSTLKNGDAFSVKLYNNAVANRLNIPTKFPAGELTLVSLTEGVEVRAVPGGWEISYNPAKAPATAKIAIYRGDEKVVDGGANVVDAGTYRYIKTVQVNLVTAAPGTPYVKITNKPAIDKTFGHGQKVVVEGTVEGLDAALIGVEYLGELPEGITGSKTFIRPANLILDTNGNFTFEFDLTVVEGNNVAAAKPFGEYRIVVGQIDSTDAEWRYYDTVNFRINTMIVSEEVKNDTKTVAKNRTAEYVLTQFAAKSGALTVTLTTDDGQKAVLDYSKEPEKFPNIAEAVADQYVASLDKTQIIEGVQYEIPAAWANYAKADEVDGVVELTVKRPNGGTTGGPGVSKSITLDRSVLKSEYYPGEGITIRGTSRGYDVITVTVTNPDGTKWTFTMTPEEFANGYILRLTEPGVYQIDVEGEKFTVVIVALNVGIFRTDHFNYVVGYEDGTVRPEANISREEVAAILYRLLKEDVRAGFYQDSTNAYSDVEADRWSMANIATLNNMGIIKGYEDNTFRPGRAITRAEFAALLSRLASTDAAPVVVPSFSDVDGHWAINEIYVAAAQGWFVGDTAGTFRPDDRITRAEAITVINRVLSRDKVTTESFKDMDIVEFSDLAADAWYYVQVVEATNAHDFAKDETTGEETWTASKEETNWAE